MTVTILKGDCREVLGTLPAESVHCVVTSPPYFGLRDYGVGGQIGLEPTPDAFVAELVGVFRELRRVLRSDATAWLNIGDSYAGGGTIGRNDAGRNLTGGGGNKMGSGNPGPQGSRQPVADLKSKDLIGIPWRVAFALQADGWYLRQDIIWSKPNPMPESVRDRCTKAHEYLFLLSKRERYYYDAEAIKERVTGHGFLTTNHKYNGNADELHRTKNGLGAIEFDPDGKRNKRSVWEISTAPYAEAHFATFPPALIEPCILAGCPEKCCAKCGAPWVRKVEAGEPTGRRDNGLGDKFVDLGMSKGRAGSRERKTVGFVPSCACNWEYTTSPGVVLDPFGGAGTTGLVADRLGRNAILIELNPEYADMAERRIRKDAGLFAEVAAG